MPPTNSVPVVVVVFSGSWHLISVLDEDRIVQDRSSTVTSLLAIVELNPSPMIVIMEPGALYKVLWLIESTLGTLLTSKADVPS